MRSNNTFVQCFFLLHGSVTNVSTRNESFLPDLLNVPDGCRIPGGVNFVSAIAVCIILLLVLCIAGCASALQRYRKGLQALFRA